MRRKTGEREERDLFDPTKAYIRCRQSDGGEEMPLTSPSFSFILSPTLSSYPSASVAIARLESRRIDIWCGCTNRSATFASNTRKESRSVLKITPTVWLLSLE